MDTRTWDRPDLIDVPPAPEHPRDNCGWCQVLPPVQPVLDPQIGW